MSFSINLYYTSNNSCRIRSRNLARLRSLVASIKNYYRIDFCSDPARNKIYSEPINPLRFASGIQDSLRSFCKLDMLRFAAAVRRHFNSVPFWCCALLPLFVEKQCFGRDWR